MRTDQDPQRFNTFWNGFFAAVLLYLFWQAVSVYG